MDSVNEILVGEGLFVRPTSPLGVAHLIGSKCRSCAEVTFPKQPWCANCGGDAVELPLSTRGKLYSFTNVHNAPPEGYKGPIPYGVGSVEVDGVRIMCNISESNPAKLSIGMEMELVVDALFVDDDGNRVVGFWFKPAAE
ncbi:MAG: Zn-ribbon domain-containing OB-fold protein [Thermoleophilia bacterium]